MHFLPTVPANLYNAVAVAGDPSAAGKGVMVVMNDRVLGARDVTKTNTTGVETFQSPNAGQLATIHNGKVLWDAAPVTKHTTQTPFKVDGLDKLPRSVWSISTPELKVSRLRHWLTLNTTVSLLPAWETATCIIHFPDH